MKPDGTTQCHDECPAGTYDKGLVCTSCGSICDLSFPVTLSAPLSPNTPSVGLLVDQGGQYIVEKGLQGYIRKSRISYSASQILLSEVDLETDASSNSYPFARDLLNATGVLYSGYPNGLFSYQDRYSDSLSLEPQNKLSMSCTFMTPTPEKNHFLCGDSVVKKVTEIYDGKSVWSCDIPVEMSSLYMDPLESAIQGQQMFWVGSANKVLLISKPGCQVLSTTTFSS